MRRYKDDFPILAESADGRRLVYLDNGATTQKPQQVLDAVNRYYLTENANPHRGVYDLAMRATDAHENSRAVVAKFIGAPEDTVIFTQNTSEGLNLVAYSYGRAFLKPGDEVLIYVAEHHSNLVPWQWVAKTTGAELKYLYPDANGRLTVEELDAKINERTKVVAVAHVSNVLGLETPVQEIVKRAHAVGAVVVLDIAQSVAHMPLDVVKLDVDFASLSGHKIYAPMGVGAVYGKKELLEKMPPFLSGGDMIEYVEEQETTFAELPQKFEAGTQNVGGAAGLSAAIDYLQGVGFEMIERIERDLTTYAIAELKKIPYVELYGCDVENKIGIVAFNIKDVHPHDVATILDAEGVAIRAGHHCAQPLIKYLGQNATCRASFYFYNTRRDVERLIEAIQKVRSIMRLT